jgi:hypothetical protein
VITNEHGTNIDYRTEKRRIAAKERLHEHGQERTHGQSTPACDTDVEGHLATGHPWLSAWAPQVAPRSPHPLPYSGILREETDLQYTIYMLTTTQSDGLGDQTDAHDAACGTSR